ncbi:MAG: hypothetical protein AABZ47_07965 [Planctomycetota bacterium]
MTDDTIETETVAGLVMTVATAEPSEVAQKQWAQRSEALATWLFAEWYRELAVASNGATTDYVNERRRS